MLAAKHRVLSKVCGGCYHVPKKDFQQVVYQQYVTCFLFAPKNTRSVWYE